MRKLHLFWSLLLIVSLLLPAVAAAQDITLIGGNPAFDETAAEEEGYWYSRYNMSNLTMVSGLGEPFMPDMAMMQQMMQMADANPDDGDTPMPPVGVTLLQSIYASGDPHFTQPVDMADAATMQWDPATFDTTVTTPAMGWTMIKEVEWAKQFHVDDHFGAIDDDFGAQWRFIGMVIVAEAKMQAQVALQQMLNADGLFANSDGVIEWSGQWVMLEALSDLAGTLDASAMPHSVSNRYADPDAAAMFQGATDMFFQVLSDRRPADVQEASLAAQALVWYAATTTNPATQTAALAQLAQIGDALRDATPATAAEAAFAIRGLIEAYRGLGDDGYLTAAAAIFADLSAAYDATHGVFINQDTYTIDDVAVIMGALNALRFYAGDTVDQAQVAAIFTGFFESVVNLSGLQQSALPVDAGKDPFEQEDPAIFYAYPGMPLAPMAGGDFGIAPVFATAVRWDGARWGVTDSRFDAAGAMHAADEFIWFHNDEVNGFPTVTVLAALASDATTNIAEPSTSATAADVTPSALPVTGAVTYVVKAGDSLYRIASLELGSGARWQELYELNQLIIGVNPRLIRPGQTLIIPE